MNVIKAIKSRKSVRSFKKKVPISIVKKILEAASRQVEVIPNHGKFMYSQEKV